MEKKTKKQELQEKKALTESQLESISGQLGSIGEMEVQKPPPENGEALAIDPGASSELTAREVFEDAGLDFPFVARTLKTLLDNTTISKWNPVLKKFEFFIDGELHRRCCEFIIKVLGGFAPDTTINLNIDATLTEILQNASPEEANRLATKYLKDLAGELGVESIDVEANEVRGDGKSAEVPEM